MIVNANDHLYMYIERLHVKNMSYSGTMCETRLGQSSSVVYEHYTLYMSLVKRLFIGEL